MSDWMQRSGFEAAQREYERQLPPESKVCGECAVCGSYICEGEEFYSIIGNIYCTDCMDEFRHTMEAG